MVIDSNEFKNINTYLYSLSSILIAFMSYYLVQSINIIKKESILIQAFITFIIVGIILAILMTHKLEGILIFITLFVVFIIRIAYQTIINDERILENNN